MVLQGRFEMFQLARSLPARGHDVTLFMNYPARIIRRFGVTDAKVRSFWVHGGMQRALQPVPSWLKRSWEPALHRLFGRWAASQVVRERWDLVISMSGVSEELLRALRGTETLTLLVRASSHIRTQAAILEEEERRTGIRLDRPSPWMIGREEREYELAKQIRVLSDFTRKSFLQQRVPGEKVHLIPSAMPTETFRPGSEAVGKRLRRILSGDPLRVLYVGAISLRKGLWDLAASVSALPRERFHFRLVGPMTREARGLLDRLRERVEVVPLQPESKLPAIYEAADLFLFPTLEDGYAQTLAQAYVAGLPIITTDRCQGPDFLIEGKTGWVIPSGAPETITARLTWADTHREELAEVARRIYETALVRTWADAAVDIERFVRQHGNI